MELRLQTRGAFFRLEADVGTIGLKFARFDVIVEKAWEDFVDDLVAQDRVFDWKSDLNAANKIARHPIGAGEIQVRLPGVFEIVDAAVLEKPSHDADDANVFAQVGNLRPEATDAAHDQVDLHSGGRGFVEFFDYTGIDQ